MSRLDFASLQPAYLPSESDEKHHRKQRLAAEKKPIICGWTDCGKRQPAWDPNGLCLHHAKAFVARHPTWPMPEPTEMHEGRLIASAPGLRAAIERSGKTLPRVASAMDLDSHHLGLIADGYQRAEVALLERLCRHVGCSWAEIRGEV